MENAVAQICREGGARVSINIILRDLDLDLAHFPTGDRRRLEVVAEGLSLFAAASWPSAPHWCRLSNGMRATEGTLTKEMESPCLKHASKREDLHRAPGEERTRVDGGHRGRSWRQVVGGNERFPWGVACEKVSF